MTGKPNLYAIVGMKNYEGAETLIAAAPPDEPVMLVREPTNKYDSNAVQVWMKNAGNTWTHVGYVPKTQNAVLSQFIAAHGKPWALPAPILAADAVMPKGFEVFRAVHAKLHKGSNTYPLVEVG